MRKTREILRLRWGHGRSLRAISRSVGASASSVSECIKRAEAAGLSWPVDSDLDDGALEARLYPSMARAGGQRPQPDCEQIHRELRRKGVTLQLLWEEYKESHTEDGYEYTQFCEYYRRYRKSVDVVLRQHHRAGEKVFVDFSGDGIPIHDPGSGKVREAPLFVAVLGASSYFYVEALECEDLSCWIQGHVHAYEFFGGVPEITVPDQPRTAVSRPCYYDPDLNPTYLDLARHYDTVVIPARPRKPRDKAKAETTVLIAQRWILAALRNHRFFSVREANEVIREKLKELNRRRFQKLDASRRELFETLDQPALRPLPAKRYEYAEWSSPRVNIDYHVQVDRCYYSVHFELAGKQLEARSTATTVELLFKGRRVASHERSRVPGTYTTIKEHMPKAHQRYLEWSPSRLLRWAGTIGAATEDLVGQILSSKPHPEQGYRACLGVLRMGKSYGPERLEAASKRAIAIGSCSYKSVKSILSTGLDQQPLATTTAPEPARNREHANLRGAQYYK